MLLNLRDDAKHEGTTFALLAGPHEAGRIFDVTETRHLFDWRDRFLL